MSRRSLRRLAHMFLAVGLLAGLSGATGAPAGGLDLHFVLPATPTAELPSGIPAVAEPSHEAPPGATSFPGYVQTYVQDFSGPSLPPNWDVFTGKANGGSGSQWGSAHVVVGGGLLSLNTWRDPAYNNQWVSGGVCMCGAPSTYGAFFVRSRETGPGPTVVELLWPAASWPPEIDFNETNGATNGTTATLRFGPASEQRQVRRVVDMTQWHTWGVIWTPASVLYTVDGRIWGRFQVPSKVPHVSMTINIQQQTWCSANWACPTSPQSTLVDWVSEFKAIPRDPVTVGSFVGNASSLSSAQRVQIASLAKRIQAQGDLHVTLIGYSGSTRRASSAVVVGERRAAAVKRYLDAALKALGDPGVIITTVGRGRPTARASDHSASASAFNRVTAHLS